jgi:ribosome biogenesis GTP-binding protein YsxC/EngB
MTTCIDSNRQGTPEAQRPRVPSPYPYILPIAMAPAPVPAPVPARTWLLCCLLLSLSALHLHAYLHHISPLSSIKSPLLLHSTTSNSEVDLIQERINYWKKLKDAGILKGIRTVEDVEELDRKIADLVPSPPTPKPTNKNQQQPQQTKSNQILKASKQSISPPKQPIQESRPEKLLQAFVRVAKTDRPEATVVEAALQSLIRNNVSTEHVDSAVYLYSNLVAQQLLPNNASLIENIVRQGWVSVELWAHLRDLRLLSSSCIQIQTICRRLQSPSLSLSSKQIIIEEVKGVIKEVQHFQRSDLNHLLRLLTKQSLLDQAVELMQAMRSSPKQHSRPDAQSIEWFLQALLLGVEEERRVDEMKLLPSPTKDRPEILLLGRSNVGKSSLVNALLNRKNLASVSSQPGHTQEMHFYSLALRKGNLALVDAPGLGYAVTVDEERRQRWQWLLQRYLAVRKICKLVLHLVDHRIPLTAVDKDILSLVVRSQEQRVQANLPLFRLVILLTKADKENSEAASNIEQRKMELNEEWQRLLSESSLEQTQELRNLLVVVTSTREKRGIEIVWREMLR